MSGVSVRKQNIGQHVRAQPYVEKTFVESITGFIQEVAPQSAGTTVQYEEREKVMWVKFDQCDLTDFSLCKDLQLGTNPPLLLIIGYAKGVQVWMIPDSGLALELLSYRKGPVKCFKILKRPELINLSDDGLPAVDEFSLKRPLSAICDSSSSYQIVSFHSLKTGDQVKAMKFTEPVQEFYANKRIFVVAFPTDLAIFNTNALDELFKVTCCYPREGDSLNPVALGSAWMAFTDNRLHSVHQSKGTISYESGSTYKSTMLHAAKSITKGLFGLGGTVASNIMGQSGSPLVAAVPRAAPGIVTVLEVSKVKVAELSLQSVDCGGIICHFEAHHGSPLACMEFDASGFLLATADENGHTFNVFRLHPNDSYLNVVQHLYTLKRGDTTSTVVDMSFSIDSRWMSVSTHRGTTHVFPISPYGGSIEARTHLVTHVVNRLSRYQRSVGIQESEAGYTGSSRTASPIAKQFSEPGAGIYQQFACSGPVVVEPMAQLKRPMFQNLFESLAKQSPTTSPKSNNRKYRPVIEDTKIACCFGVRRSHLDGPLNVSGAPKQPLFADALFVVCPDGIVLEYDLRPKISASIPTEKRSDTNPIELDAEPVAQWSLLRELSNMEVQPPYLHHASPLLASLPEKNPITSHQDLISRKDVELQWEAQVECSSYVGPIRRLWMGPLSFFNPTNQINRMDTDSQKQFLPDDGSTPTFVTASVPTSDQGHRFGTSFDSESEEYMTKVRSDLAAAILDDHCDFDADVSSRKKYKSRRKFADDDDDVLDISCEPVGRPLVRPPSNYADAANRVRVESSFQDVARNVYSVALMEARLRDHHPLWGAHTPTLDECRAMTSSAEELSATLSHGRAEGPSPPHSDWQPIDPPPAVVQRKPRSKPPLERPTPLDGRCPDSPGSSMDIDPYCCEPKPVAAYQSSSAWSKVEERRENDVDFANILDEQQHNAAQSPREPSSKSLSSCSAKSSSIKSSATSANTSEDDYVSRDVKNGRKKRRKNKIESAKDDVATILVDTKEVRVAANSTVVESLIVVDDSGGFATNDVFEFDADNFHPAKEYHDVPCEDFHDSGENEEYSSFNQLEELVLGSDDEAINPCPRGGLLTSIHDEDDLAKALEEASSEDDSRPVKSCVRPANEMFPFRDASSDDEGIGHVIRRRAPLHFYPDDDDQETTSGDDRKTTSESDVTNSPNPHAANSIRGKKKKKKRK